ncbi:type VII secretion-associated serine protease mycosin (plasmid) [Rhodococcus sp. H-CA8f]|uniref:type VII secretion-associated serine protease mycosin n=1 Tax=Rhodococcus sp. H-CA8f TaxID=1727214 RepID=UPI000BE4686F|nr:type VII secretion-associated serine protease mycosin [Rhodococcus sp. H-CA8f]ATI36331.1 type VII secretion-associated serine protease mycosin [Rhodococcus sp. H-CA8f]
MMIRRAAAVAGAVGVLLATAAVPAAAVEPPDIPGIPLTTPDDPNPAPSVPMVQKTACATSATLAGSEFTRATPANVAFGVENLHRYATGKGITVAVVDSGVSPGVRLPRLTGGGDYITTTNGLEDCDHHGTLVAGIIGAAPASTDGFVGVAPDASILSIRQTSSAYEPADKGPDAPAGGSSTLATLARSIVRAANSDVDVINLSITACYPTDQFVDTSDVAAALKYAVEVKDVVVVTAAGNSGSDACKSNPGYDPANGGDPRNWNGVEHVSMPSFYAPLALSVGGTTLTGEAYTGTMAGPWVTVAAPAVDIVSLDPTKGDNGGLTNATVGKDGPRAISGTSFASAYVAGLAALIREMHPDLTAREVMDRIRNTAHTPGSGDRNLIGEGVVDPIAALTSTTADIPAATASPSYQAAGAPGTDVETLIRNITIIAIGGVCILGLIVAVAYRMLREDRS